jgi:hypothetical protein
VRNGVRKSVPCATGKKKKTTTTVRAPAKRAPVTVQAAR